MAKEDKKVAAAAAPATTAAAPAAGAAGAAEASGAKEEGAKSAIVLPNGVRRIDFIRDRYYRPEGDPLKLSRSAIRVAINEMYKAAGQESTKIAYQIVFQATKSKTDPRVKAPAPAAVAATPAATA